MVGDIKFNRTKYIVISGGTIKDMYEHLKHWLTTIDEDDRGNWIVRILYHLNGWVTPSGCCSKESAEFVEARTLLTKIATEIGTQVYDLGWQGPGDAKQWFEKELLEKVEPCYNECADLLKKRWTMLGTEQVLHPTG